MIISQPFINKYRPNTFNDIIGQDYAVRFLSSAVKYNKHNSGWLIHGPWGLGKTTLVRVYAKAILCDDIQDGINPCNKCESCISIDEGNNINYYEQDAASNRKVKDIDDLLAFCSTMPYKGKPYKIVALDECHALTKEAEDKLLKPLEDGLNNIIFVFLTTDIEAVKPATISRVQVIEVASCASHIIVERLKFICEEEELVYDIGALEILAKNSEGHIRDAIKLLDQLSKIGDITLEEVSNYFLNTSNLDIARILLAIPTNFESSLEMLGSLANKTSCEDIHKMMMKVCMNVLKSRFSSLDTSSSQEINLYTEILNIYGDKLLFCSDYLSTLGKHSLSDISILESGLFVINSYLAGTVVSFKDIKDKVESGKDSVKSGISSREYRKIKDSTIKAGSLLAAEDFARMVGAELK